MTSPPPASSGGEPPESGEPPADGRSARAQRRREETRSAILEAARVVFRTQGYHQASVADIVQQATVARGTFYLYFDNKQDVLHVLLERFLESIRAQVQRISTGPGAAAPIDQVRANFGRILACIEEQQDVATIFFASEATLDEESRARIDTFWAQVEGMVADALSVGQALGLVRPCNRAATAVMALGAVRGLFARMLRASDGSELEGLGSPEDLVEELIPFVLRGLLRDPGQSTR